MESRLIFNVELEQNIPLQGYAPEPVEGRILQNSGSSG